ncbi:unnamed protein product [Coregonus sp. 'balchen']|nr:unnamed protein product [Coregonus sp. 'balchen']
MTNTMTSTVLISFLACLILVNVEGQVGHSKSRVTLKNVEGKKCLNPEAPIVKNNIEKWMKNQRSVQ